MVVFVDQLVRVQKEKKNMSVVSMIKGGKIFLEKHSHSYASAVIFHTVEFLTFSLEVEKILKGSLDSIPSPSVKIQIMGRKVLEV